MIFSYFTYLSQLPLPFILQLPFPSLTPVFHLYLIESKTIYGESAKSDTSLWGRTEALTPYLVSQVSLQKD